MKDHQRPAYPPSATQLRTLSPPGRSAVLPSRFSLPPVHWLELASRSTESSATKISEPQARRVRVQAGATAEGLTHDRSGMADRDTIR
jgi:hypothetical protein